MVGIQNRSAKFFSSVLWVGISLLFLSGCTQGLMGHNEVPSRVPMAISVDDETRLTSDPAEEYAPAWSPDGRYIAYTVKDNKGNFDITRIQADGGHPIRLTINPTYDGLPAWSPDGSEIAFESDRDLHADIWAMDINGQNPRKLSRSGEGHFTPIWSPTGTWILYESIPLTSELSGNRELWVMDREGRNARKLADGFNPQERDLFFTSGHFHLPSQETTLAKPARTLTVSKPYDIFTCGLSWSPDGKRIAFESVRGGSVAIWVMNSDGSNPAQLTRDLSNNWHPAWSPDGNRIAFASDRSGNYDLWVMDADGHHAMPLTEHPASDFRPAWSPDGKKIVFTSLRSGNADLWVIKLKS